MNDHLVNCSVYDRHVRTQCAVNTPVTKAPQLPDGGGEVWVPHIAQARVFQSCFLRSPGYNMVQSTSQVRHFWLRSKTAGGYSFQVHSGKHEENGLSGKFQSITCEQGSMSDFLINRTHFSFPEAAVTIRVYQSSTPDNRHDES